MDQVTGIIEKIDKKEITIGVIGIGYVGLPLALEYAKQGIKTIGFDIDTVKVDSINKGINYNEDLDSNEIEEVARKGFLTATADFSQLAGCDCIYICVPTPFTPNKDPDISFIEEASRSVLRSLKQGQIVILKSTTFPGTTENHVQPILEQGGMKAGSDFYLAFSPERIDPGNKTWNTKNTPIIVGGINEVSTGLACRITKKIGRASCRERV